jgi:AraC-like DNA-binding protein
MKYCTIPPPPKLARYVRCFWVYEGEASTDKPYIYRGYADGCTELVFHYRGVFDQLIGHHVEKSFAAGIHAQTERFTRFVVDRDWGIFGCYLFPYAIPKLFSLPASDLTDQLTDLSSLLGCEGCELEERIMLAGDNTSRAEILSEFLERRLERNHRELPVVFSSINHIIETRGLVDVGDLARNYYLSNRQFERKFKELSGFPPKLFSRIIRFQAALKEYGSNKSLTDIAHDCGYYDQSHFINDFKEFSGYNPKIYFSGNAEGSEYLEA